MKPWEQEHGRGFDVPSAIEHLVSRKVFIDTSWHNDTAPSFCISDPKNEEYGIRLWVDHPLKSLREMEGQRFGVTLGEFGTEADDEISTDELEEALVQVFEWAKDARFDGTEIRKQPWWDDEAAPFELMQEFIEHWTRR